MERRNTIQKELVLSAVKTMHRHVTADEVFEFIKTEHPNIGKGTVYRNLGILSEENKIRRVEISDGPDRYDFTLEKHYHAECIRCGALFDIYMDEVKNPENYIRSSADIKILDYDIMFKGICKNCQKEENNGQQSNV